FEKEDEIQIIKSSSSKGSIKKRETKQFILEKSQSKAFSKKFTKKKNYLILLLLNPFDHPLVDLSLKNSMLLMLAFLFFPLIQHYLLNFSNYVSYYEKSVTLFSNLLEDTLLKYDTNQFINPNFQYYSILLYPKNIFSFIYQKEMDIKLLINTTTFIFFLVFALLEFLFNYLLIVFYTFIYFLFASFVLFLMLKVLNKFSKEKVEISLNSLLRSFTFSGFYLFVHYLLFFHSFLFYLSSMCFMICFFISYLRLNSTIL
ncbi:MAG: hypothetical protein QXD62_02710, partial [Candidatus Woesearchaeota archaeon]